MQIYQHKFSCVVARTALPLLVAKLLGQATNRAIAEASLYSRKYCVASCRRITIAYILSKNATEVAEAGIETCLPLYLLGMKVLI